MLYSIENENYAEIDKSHNSSIRIIADELNATIEQLFFNEHKKTSFARIYTNTKKEIFSLMDYKFCIFERKPIKITNAYQEEIYIPPTNFIRFLKNDNLRNNTLITSCSMSEAIKNLWYSWSKSGFKYIGYIRDSNNELRQIPNEMKNAIAYHILKYEFTDKLNSLNKGGNVEMKYIRAMSQLNNLVL